MILEMMILNMIILYLIRIASLLSSNYINMYEIPSIHPI